MFTRQFWIVLVITAILSFLGGSATGGLDLGSMFRPRQAVWVIDGDTIKLGSQSLRLLNIDAPEVSRPDCEAERALGDKATARLRDLLASGALTIAPNGRLDKFGRPLVRLAVDGRDVGDLLIAEGLAKPWPVKGDPGWCPAVS